MPTLPSDQYANRSFGRMSTGSTNATQVFTFNRGSVASISIAGTNAGSFQIKANTCVAMLTPSHTCETDVTFAPIAAGNASATLMWDPPVPIDIVLKKGGTAALSITSIGITGANASLQYLASAC